MSFLCKHILLIKKFRYISGTFILFKQFLMNLLLNSTYMYYMHFVHFYTSLNFSYETHKDPRSITYCILFLFS